MNLPLLQQNRPAPPVFFTAFALVVLGASAALLLSPQAAYALLPGVGILLLLLLWHAPEFGFYPILFLIPFGAFRGGGEGAELLRIHWVLAAGLVVTLVLKSLTKRETAFSLRSNLWSYLFLYLGVTLVSALFSEPDFAATAWQNVGLLLAAYLFIALCMVLLSREALSGALPKALLGSMVISCLLSILDHFFGFSLFSKEGRSVGGSFDANNFSLMCIFCLPLLFHFFFHASTVFRRFLYLAGIVVILLGVVLSFSRGGGLVLVITLALVLLSHRKRFQPKVVGLALVGLLGGALLVGMMLPEGYWDRYGRLGGSDRDKSVGRRVAYLHVAAESFIHHPLLGTGPGTFRDVFAQSDYAWFFHREGSTLRRFAHNSYVEVGVGTGVLGLVFFGGLLLRAMRNLRDAKRRLWALGDEAGGSLVQAYQVAFFSLLIYMLFFSGVYHKYLLLSLAVAQVVCALGKPREEAP